MFQFDYVCRGKSSLIIPCEQSDMKAHVNKAQKSSALLHG